MKILENTAVDHLLAKGYSEAEISAAENALLLRGITPDEFTTLLQLTNDREDRAEREKAEARANGNTAGLVDFIRSVNEAVTQDGLTGKIAELYAGQTPNRGCKIKCIWHSDATPSLHVYPNGYYCFGCGEHRDPVGFVADACGVKQYEAAKRLNDDFCLGIAEPPPPTRRARSQHEQSYQPDDYSDVAEGRIFSTFAQGKVFYNSRARGGTGAWYWFDGTRWIQAPLKAQALAQDLTDKQMAEARAMLKKARTAKDAAVESGDDHKAEAARAEEKSAERYRSFVLGQRKSSRITATLTEARPALEYDILDCDADPHLLNSPIGTYDLRTGQRRDHDPDDHITKITAVAPTYDGIEKWYKHIQTVTAGDADLAEYLQVVAGSFMIGRVDTEQLTIATGEGGGGKSTTFNAMMTVLGDYAGQLSPEVFMLNNNRNKGAELATLQGKRLIVAAELSDGKTLDTGSLKRICSTDRIRCEPKYETPYDFTPSHHVVMYCNTLPAVRSMDVGTWDRIVILPFNARLRHAEGETKNYAEELCRECGGAILQWMIDGAKLYLDAGCKIDPPLAVLDEIAKYHDANDWAREFVQECCQTGPNLKDSATALYKRYCLYCDQTGEYRVDKKSFASALRTMGFTSVRSSAGVMYKGLKTT